MVYNGGGEVVVEEHELSQKQKSQPARNYLMPMFMPGSSREENINPCRSRTTSPTSCLELEITENILINVA